MSTAPISAAAREDQVQISQQEGVYSSALAQSMKRQENRSQTASLTEMLQEAREKADAQREQLRQAKPTPRYGDAPLEAYARLSRARNQAEVNSAAGYARRRISQLQAAQRTDPDHADQIKAAIGQLQKAVGRAGKKKLELNREQLARARQKRMVREKRNREAQRVRRELQSKQTMRKIRESGYFRETEIANRMASQLAATRMELRQQAQQLESAAQKSLDAAVQQYSAAQPPASEAPAPAVDVQA